MAQVNAIEFSDVECKFISADRTKNRVVVRTLFAIELTRNEDAAARVNERSQLLKDAMKTHKVKPGPVQVIIPKNYVMARMVTLPSTSEDEIAGMARFEAERHIPFNAERHVVAFHVLAKQGVQGSQVLLAAVDRPIADEYLQVCQKAGLTVEKLGVSSLTLFNAVSLSESSVMANRVVAIVNVGALYTDIVIANNGAVNFTRGASLGINRLFAEVAEADPKHKLALEDLPRIDAVEPQRFFAPHTVAQAQPTDTQPPAFPPLGASEFGSPFDGEPATADSMPIIPLPPAVAVDVGAPADSGQYPSISAQPMPLEPVVAPPLPEDKASAAATKWLLRLLQEVRRTYDFARREFNCPLIEQIYLSGDGAIMKNLPQFLRVNFGIECTVFDPTRIADLPKKQLEGSLERAPAYASLIGAVVPPTPNAVDINLIPEEFRERQVSKRQQRSYMISGALALVALVCGYILVSNTLRGQQDLLSKYRDRNQSDKSRVAELEMKETRLKIIRNYVQERHGALDVLEKISGIPFIPERVTLTQFVYDKPGGKSDEIVKIKGHAKSIADVNKMEQALEELGFFETVEQDQGSGNWVPLRQEKVLAYSMTAKFKKDAKAKADKKMTPAPKSKGENTDGAE